MRVFDILQRIFGDKLEAGQTIELDAEAEGGEIDYSLMYDKHIIHTGTTPATIPPEEVSYRDTVAYICDVVANVPTEDVAAQNTQEILTEIHCACMNADPTLDTDSPRHRAAGVGLLTEGMRLLRRVRGAISDEPFLEEVNGWLERAGHVADPEIPVEYRCSGCGAFGVRLWREYQTRADRLTLKCRACSEAERKYGKESSARDFRTDAIGWRVPAIPDDTGTYWGYASVPRHRYTWWTSLPETQEAPR